LAITPDQFITFGELLKYLRRQAGLTQRELSIAVGYSDTQISRIEQNQRVPDQATLTAHFVPALDLEREPEWVARLLKLAAEARLDEVSVSHPSPLPTRVHNLPLQLTSFIGREKEIAEVKRLLVPLSPASIGAGAQAEDHPRLITLTGPGGTGKTRLLLQAAAQILNSFPDGVWLVELASLADSGLVSQAVGTVLGIREGQETPLLTLLIDYLRDKRLLLLLDNCEHVVDTCAQLSETLLQSCSHLHILTSSREALGIAGETIFHVPSLSLPDTQHQTPDELSQCESVRLFIERAKSALPDFQLTAKNASAIAQVCQQLDGIPLALELAAAKVNVLRVEQIAARLSDRFLLLTGGSRTALPRHQTLRATMDWSYDLLRDDERLLLRRCQSLLAAGIWRQRRRLWDKMTSCSTIYCRYSLNW
jgi:transcriptional regulator with XRE-family HTH domain